MKSLKQRTMDVLILAQKTADRRDHSGTRQKIAAVARGFAFFDDENFTEAWDQRTSHIRMKTLTDLAKAMLMRTSWKKNTSSDVPFDDVLLHLSNMDQCSQDNILSSPSVITQWIVRDDGHCVIDKLNDVALYWKAHPKPNSVRRSHIKKGAGLYSTRMYPASLFFNRVVAEDDILTCNLRIAIWRRLEKLTPHRRRDRIFTREYNADFDILKTQFDYRLLDLGPKAVKSFLSESESKARELICRLHMSFAQYLFGRL